jgi:hypothetical protein
LSYNSAAASWHAIRQDQNNRQNDREGRLFGRSEYNGD